MSSLVAGLMAGGAVWLLFVPAYMAKHGQRRIDPATFIVPGFVAAIFWMVGLACWAFGP